MWIVECSWALIGITGILLMVNSTDGAESMATLSAWLSILVKHGLEIIKPQTVVKCLWEDTFGEVGCDRCQC